MQPDAVSQEPPGQQSRAVPPIAIVPANRSPVIAAGTAVIPTARQGRDVRLANPAKLPAPDSNAHAAAIGPPHKCQL